VTPYAMPPAVPTPALPLAVYGGSYRNDYVGKAVVAEEGDGLTLRLGPNGSVTFPLKHFDRDIFLIYPSEEAPTLPCVVRFAIGPGQKADQVMIDVFSTVGQGVLERMGP
jgi:hypothetical protein